MQIEEVEAALARLMPPALSQSCHAELEAMFDERAGSAVVVKSSSRRWRISAGIAAGIAAILTAVAFLPGTSQPAMAASGMKARDTSWVLVSESERMEAMTDEGWRDQVNGSAMRAVRLKMVGENLLKDAETGITVRVSEPREEIVFMPISAF